MNFTNVCFIVSVHSVQDFSYFQRVCESQQKRPGSLIILPGFHFPSLRTSETKQGLRNGNSKLFQLHFYQVPSFEEDRLFHFIF